MRDHVLFVDDRFDLAQEPWVVPGDRLDILDAQPFAEGLRDLEDTFGGPLAERGDDLVARHAFQLGHPVEPVEIGFETAQRLLHRFGKAATDRHDLTDRFHRGRQFVLGALELLEREARDLGHDIVDRRFETGRGRAGDLVLDLVERIAHRQLGGDARDRETGRLRCQRGGPRHARVHLDHDQAAIFRIDRELDVRAAGFDPDLAQHVDAGGAHDLVFLVSQRQRRRHGDAVAGMHAHRIDILDRTDDDAIVLAVAHHLHLEFLPPEERFLDQDFGGGRGFEAFAHDPFELGLVIGDPAAGAAQREAGTDDRRQAGAFEHRKRLVHRIGDAAARAFEPDLVHRLAETLAVLGLVDRIGIGADHLHAVFLESAVVEQRQRAVERGLPAHRRQHRVGALLGDDLGDDLGRDRLDIGRVGHFRIGHDRGRVGVDQDDPVTLFLQRLDRLRARIVELAGLADDDGTCADDEDRGDVSAFGHQSFPDSNSRESGR